MKRRNFVKYILGGLAIPTIVINTSPAKTIPDTSHFELVKSDCLARQEKPFDTYISPEALDNIRNWNVDYGDLYFTEEQMNDIDRQIRKEIFEHGWNTLMLESLKDKYYEN